MGIGLDDLEFMLSCATSGERAEMMQDELPALVAPSTALSPEELFVWLVRLMRRLLERDEVVYACELGQRGRVPDLSGRVLPVECIHEHTLGHTAYLLDEVHAR